MKRTIIYLNSFSVLTKSEDFIIKKFSSEDDVVFALKNDPSIDYETRKTQLKESFPNIEIIEQNQISSITDDSYFFLDEDNEKEIKSIHTNKLIDVRKECPFYKSEKESLDLNHPSLSLNSLYFLLDHDMLFVKELSKYLSGHRFLHSKSVAKLALEIALKNNLKDYEDIFVASLFHDIGKDLPIEETIKIMKDHYREYLNYPPWCYHQFVGEYLSKKEFGIVNKEILDAICYHCSGKANMNPLGKIVYAADKIDPLRGWDSSFYIKECERDYKKGFVEVLKANEDFLSQNGSEAKLPLSEECYNYYLRREK